MTLQYNPQPEWELKLKYDALMTSATEGEFTAFGKRYVNGTWLIPNVWAFNIIHKNKLIQLAYFLPL
jgi:hypothetical protein